MSKLIAPALLATGMLSLLSAPAEACGDKLLSMARGTRLYAAYTAWRSASILIYTVRTAALNTVKDPQLQWSLKQAGHRLQTVEEESQLDHVLSSGRFDLILADVTDASKVAQRMATLRSKPLVLPVVYKPTKAELAAAEKQFQFVLRAPARSTQHLEAIDQAMKSQVRSASGP